MPARRTRHPGRGISTRLLSRNKTPRFRGVFVPSGADLGRGASAFQLRALRVVQEIVRRHGEGCFTADQARSRSRSRHTARRRLELNESVNSTWKSFWNRFCPPWQTVRPEHDENEAFSCPARDNKWQASDRSVARESADHAPVALGGPARRVVRRMRPGAAHRDHRSEEHTSELQSLTNLVCRLLLEKKKKEVQEGRSES